VQTGSLLTITGDATNLDQSVLVAETSTPGSYNVTISDNGTQVVNTTFSGITDISIDTGSGVDTVNLSGNPTSGTGLTGNLSITGSSALTVNAGSVAGSGNSAGFNVFGSVAITDTGTSAVAVAVAGAGTSFGPTQIITGTGNDSVTFLDNATINGQLDVNLGSGADNLTMGGDGQPGGVVNGAMVVRGGSGLDVANLTQTTTGDLEFSSFRTVTLDHSTVNGHLLTQLGAGESVFIKNGSDIHGYVSINGSNTDSAHVTVANSNIDDFFSVSSGQDTAAVSNDSISFSGSHIVGLVGLDLGAGSDTVAVSTTRLESALFVNSIGKLNFSLNNSVVGDFGSLNQTGSASADTVSVNNSSITSFLSIVTGDGTGSTGNDSVALSNTRIGDNLGLDLDAGTDTLSLSDHSVVGGSLFTNGTDNLDFALNQSTIAASVSLNETGSSSADTVSVTGSSVAGFFSVVSGDGTGAAGNSITFTTSTVGDNFATDLGGDATMSFTNTALVGSLAVTTPGNLDFSLSTGFHTQGSVTLNGTGTNSTDTVSVTGAATAGTFFVTSGSGNNSISFNNDRIGSDLVVVLGGGSDTVSISGTTVTGGLAVSNQGTASVSVTSTDLGVGLGLLLGPGNDTVALTGVTVHNDAVITTGDGADSVTIAQSNFMGSTTIDTGGGADVVIVAPAADPIGTTTFFGPVSVNSTGPESVTLGASGTDLAIFFNSASFSNTGDPGSSLDKTNADFNGGGPTVSGFAKVVG
jgi:hypothetical protein